MMKRMVRVLFLCTHNSARSQMAEALLRALEPGGFDVVSAGTSATRVHPLTIAAMREVGIDIANARSKHVAEFLGQPFDYVITVCDAAAEACPTFPGPVHRIHWSFPDPSAATGSEAERLQAFRDVRDAIDRRLRAWTPGVLAEQRQ